MKPTPLPRLSILQAPAADVAVIFRRGPSKHVEVVRWDMRRDSFVRGHWFQGRIYTRRSDLSPDGKLLVYFASKFNSQTVNDGEYTYAWTAVSRVPWLTALGLWPKGDCWHGGGLFLSNHRLLLNHKPERASAHPKHRPPASFKVEPNPEAKGEDDPLYTRRLERDGWECTQSWEIDYHGLGLFYQTRTPEHRERKHATFPLSIVMERRLDGLTYTERFSIAGKSLETLPEGRVDWMDWDSQGRLLVLVSGQLLVAEMTRQGPGEFRVLEDFVSDRFEARESPPAAHTW